ncbi:MAG: hypothetical protein R3F14_18840 [Polyangiaceae bacterium]
MRSALGAVGLVAALALAPASEARAEPSRVVVEVAGVEDDAVRAVRVRLVSELRAAGFKVVAAADTSAGGGSDGGGSDGDGGVVRASLVARDGRWALFVELPDAGSLVVRADDVSPSELPAVLAR